METPYVWKGAVVCKSCHGTLSQHEKDEAVEQQRRDAVLLEAENLRRLGVTKPPSARGEVPRQFTPYEPVKALGLTSRGQCWFVAIVGLLLSPALVGIPLAVWGIVAESQIRKQLKERQAYLK